MSRLYARGPAVLIGFIPMADADPGGKLTFNFAASSAYEQTMHYTAVFDRLAADKSKPAPDVFAQILDEMPGFETMVIPTLGDAGPFPAMKVAADLLGCSLLDQRWDQLEKAQRCLYPVKPVPEMALDRVGHSADTKTLGEFLLYGAKLTRMFTGGCDSFAASIASLDKDGLPVARRPLQVDLLGPESIRVTNFDNQAQRVYSFTVTDPYSGVPRRAGMN